ncbi:hypothetical protein FZI85_14000 [Mycobacterium sp. CBMA293]|uniref:hypothetical protein n=1 Tax=unclassified Mycolicibacterium TaxID=2636767 RepID=UPI0012DE52A7|nr:MULTISPECIES: hypothetical protein [unclassified Mycolicibacterium]MUL49815.1 hypothetical protein [Mycolicibacterium sp. CBMA 360]MUL59644.1 hypothetical protein [Mycolicibacterium sp. CBMA 335]MUL71369.1 hypothetical protein [Mycolicibacterium sp. CBMA 311]MUL95012.1 hypothetical protein [Mycolicibacterium sp. CBMA 230]MUM03851.1 hypothetical protein [Mycolicibacterium sp. CBMA 213]
MPIEKPDPPPWIAGLPKDAWGFPVPAEARWLDGVPLLSTYDRTRAVALVTQRACAVCGFEIPHDSLFYRAWDHTTADDIRAFGRKRSYDDAGPCHLSCIVYSAIVCPHLNNERAHLNKDRRLSPGAKRGLTAAIIGFARSGLLIPDPRKHPLSPYFPYPLIAFVGVTTDFTYRNGSELHQLLSEAIALDSSIIDTSKPRCFWRDSPDEIDAVLDAAEHGTRELMGSKEPDYSTEIELTAPDSRYVNSYCAYLV